MVKIVFFSTIKATIFSIIITLIAYNIYSPLKKDPIYKLEMVFEPNEKILIINPDNPTKIEFKFDGQNDYFILKEIEKLVLGVHEYGSIGQCKLEKIKSRIPYTLTKESKYYSNIRLKLLSRNKSNLEKCVIEVNNRINNFFEERREILLKEFNELQSYNMKYLAETHALETLLQMGMFTLPNTTNKQDVDLNQDRKKIFDQISNNFLNYRLTLDKQARDRIAKFMFIRHSKVDISIDDKNNLNKLPPFMILTCFFLIVMFTLIDLIFIKKIKLKRILKNLFR